MAEVDLNFLTQVYEIIKSLEQESPDQVGKKVNDLKQSLALAKEQVAKLPGCDYNKEDQLKQLEVLRQQLATKSELLHKYKHLCNFDLAKDTKPHLYQ